MTGSALLIVFRSLGRPVVWRYWGQAIDQARAKAIILRCGNTSLDYFKLWSDKIYFFASNGAGVVSFRLVGKVALALGDPNACSEADFTLLLSGFLDYCDGNDWEPVFHQVGTRYLDEYRQNNLHLLKVGEEAVIDLQTWSLQGSRFKDLRNLVRKFDRQGYRFRVVDPPLPNELVQELSQVNRDWLQVPGRRERYFTQGQFTLSYISSTPVAFLQTAEG